MNYDLFTSVPEPKINISLFGDAASQGAKVGSAIPTTTTAVIQGLQQGISQGLDWQTQAENIETANIQQEAARARLPYEDDLMQARIEDAQLTNEINRNKLEDALTTKKEAQNFTKAKLTTDTKELEAKNEQLTRETDFLNQFKNGNTEQQMNLVFGGKYTDVFARNKNIYEQALNTLYVNPKLPEEQRTYIDALRKRSNAASYYERQAQARQDTYTKAKDDLYASPLTNEILSNTSDLVPEDLPDKVEFVPAGKYEMNATGDGFKLNPRTGQRVLKEGFDPNTIKDNYVAVLKDTNKLVGQSATSNDFKVYKGYATARKLQDGTFGSIAANRLTQKGQEQQQGQGQQALPGGKNVPGVQSQAPQVQTNPEVQLIQQSLKLEPQQFRDLETPLKQLHELSQQYTGKRFTKSSLSNVKELTQVKDTISHYMVKQELDSSEAARTRYTAADVKAYNSQIDKQMAATLGMTALLTGGSSSAGLLAAKDLAAPLKIATPEELYYVQRRAVLDKTVNDLFKNMVELQKQQTSTKARSAQATQNTIRYLQAIRHGSQPTR